MNAKQLFAAVAVFALAGSASADNVAGKTRAEVLAELQQAQASGTYVVGGEPFVNQSIAIPVGPATAAPLPIATDKPDTPPTATKPAGKTRAEVIAELKQAQQDGTYVIGGSEFADPSPAVATRQRSGSGTMEAKKSVNGATGG